MSKIEQFWQDATADDVARVMAGETVEARFRDSETGHWKIAVLAGWSRFNERDRLPWASRGGLCHKFCQVYREPSWYANKPDPGPGWRLLEKFPPEELQPEDDWWGVESKDWLPSRRACRGEQQDEDVWYRRRIEPVAKFSVGQTVKVVGPKERPAMHWGKEMEPHIGFAGVIRNIPIIEAEGTFYNLEGIGIWCFREDYLEPVETVESKPVLIRRRVIEIGDEIKLPNGRVLVFNGEGFEVTQ
jgi:hypothetical protein